MIKQMMSAMIPFNGHVGVTISDVGTGTGRAEIPSSPALLNHVGTQHAAALFAVGEAASGAAMSGALASVIEDVTAVARHVEVRYLKPARGVIRATGEVADPTQVSADLARTGRVEFPVAVTLRDDSDVEVATMIVTWNVRKRGR